MLAAGAGCGARARVPIDAQHSHRGEQLTQQVQNGRGMQMKGISLSQGMAQRVSKNMHCEMDLMMVVGQTM